jgi:DNA-binding NtrC family response regulator
MGFPFAKPESQNTVRAMNPTEATSSMAKPARDAVLLVEDEQPLLDVYVAALSSFYDTAIATSAAQAESLLAQRAFKAILADNLMPGGSGLELLIRARENYPHLQRVLITGYLKSELVLRAANEAAVFRLLQKPVRMTELLNVVREAVAAHDASVAAGPH